MSARRRVAAGRLRVRVYPRAREFFELKKSLDPASTFRNKLWVLMCAWGQPPAEQPLALAA